MSASSISAAMPASRAWLPSSTNSAKHAPGIPAQISPSSANCRPHSPDRTSDKLLEVRMSDLPVWPVLRHTTSTLGDRAGSTGYSADWHRHHETNNRKRPQSELGAALTETCYRVHVKVSSWNPEPGCSRRAVGLTSVWTDGLPSEVGRDECPSGCHLPHAVIVPPTTSSKRPDFY